MFSDLPPVNRTVYVLRSASTRRMMDMTISKFIKAQITGFLGQAEAGMPIKDTSAWISQQTPVVVGVTPPACWIGWPYFGVTELSGTNASMRTGLNPWSQLARRLPSGELTTTKYDPTVIAGGCCLQHSLLCIARFLAMQSKDSTRMQASVNLASPGLQEFR